MTDPILSFKNVSFSYDPHTSVVVKDLTLSVEKGSFTVIVGPSGSGKSTLLRLAIGLDKPTGGTLTRTAKTRMIFQSGALLPWETVLENVCLGLADSKLAKKEKEKRARKALADLGIADFAYVYPRDLSGGQRQRVGIARALISEPEFMLLDEPFSALDVETSEHLAKEVLAIYETGVSMLMVSHSIEDAVMLADRVLVFGKGEILKDLRIDLPRPRKHDDPALERLVHEIKRCIPAL